MSLHSSQNNAVYSDCINVDCVLLWETSNKITNQYSLLKNIHESKYGVCIPHLHIQLVAKRAPPNLQAEKS